MKEFFEGKAGNEIARKGIFDSLNMEDEFSHGEIFSLDKDRPGMDEAKDALAITMPLDVTENRIVNIKAIGTGGAGCNAISRLSRLRHHNNNVELIALNTDVQSLNKTLAHTKIPIGGTRQGAGGHPDIGENAARESEGIIKQVLEGTELLILTAGMGGGTGTGVLPVIAELAKNKDILTFAIVYTPFDFEGDQKLRLANQGLERLKQYVDILITISNQRLVDKQSVRVTVDDAFSFADNTLKSTVESISRIINDAGKINLDFKDVKTCTKGKSSALIGVGEAKGENKISEAIKIALNNPLTDNDQSISDAENYLVYFIGKRENFILGELNTAAQGLKRLMKDADMKWGYGEDDSMEDSVKVIIIITGFGRSKRNNGIKYNGTEVEEGESLIHDLTFKNENGRRINGFDMESDILEKKYSSGDRRSQNYCREREHGKSEYEDLDIMEIEYGKTEEGLKPENPRISEKNVFDMLKRKLNRTTSTKENKAGKNRKENVFSHKELD